MMLVNYGNTSFAGVFGFAFVLLLLVTMCSHTVKNEVFYESGQVTHILMDLKQVMAAKPGAPVYGTGRFVTGRRCLGGVRTS